MKYDLCVTFLNFHFFDVFTQWFGDFQFLLRFSIVYHPSNVSWEWFVPFWLYFCRIPTKIFTLRFYMNFLSRIFQKYSLTDPHLLLIFLWRLIFRNRSCGNIFGFVRIYRKYLTMWNFDQIFWKIELWAV